MLARIQKERVYEYFLRDSKDQFRRGFGNGDTSQERVERFLGINGLFSAINTSSHWAKWSGVGIEHRLLGGRTDRHLGFDLIVGQGEGSVTLRYFPLVYGKDKINPVQFPALYLNGTHDITIEIDSLKNIHATLKRVGVTGRSIIFYGSIPLMGRTFGQLTVEPVNGSKDDYRYSLSNTSKEKNIRRPGRSNPSAQMYLPQFQ